MSAVPKSYRAARAGPADGRSDERASRDESVRAGEPEGELGPLASDDPRRFGEKANDPLLGDS